MAKLPPLPNEATALGMLAELLRRPPAGGRRPPRDPGPHGSFAAPDDADILRTYAEHEAFRSGGRAAGQAVNTHGRAVAQHNAERGQVFLQRGRLQQRMDALRREQAQAATPELARLLRRQRAELAVEAEGLDVQLARHDAALEVQRAALGRAQAEVVAAERGGRDSGGRLLALQRAAPPLGAAFTALEARFAVAACRMFLAKDRQQGARTWRHDVTLAAQEVQALHVAMVEGRYAKDDVDALMGGRAAATGEALSALVVAGELDAARALFAASCPADQFFHQMVPVFRAYGVGLYLTGEHTALAEAVRLHRWSAGVRGALAEAWWQLLHGDGPALSAALAQLVVQDWRAWSRSATPAMGLVCTTACALARLGQARGLALPASPGVSAPAPLWPAGT